MGRGEYTSIGAERGERGGRHHGDHRGGWGERGERGGRGWWGGGRGWGGGGWPYYSSYAQPYYSSSYTVPSYNYALPAYDITDSGQVYNTGQLYTPSSTPSYGWPYAALPNYGSEAFPHWRSRRHFLHRHRRRVHHILGADLD